MKPVENASEQITEQIILVNRFKRFNSLGWIIFMKVY